MDTAAAFISVVVVNLDRADLLERCLRSVEAETQRMWAARRLVVETIVVDNGSRDGSRDVVGEGFPRARLVALEHNAGFAGGVMRGIEAAAGSWILTLNNDAQLLPGAIGALLDAGAAAPDIGAVAAQLRFAGDGGATINSAGIEVDRLGVARDRLLGRPAQDGGGAVVDVFGASAGAALYRRRMLDELGGFDEAYFAFLEDVDLAWRARMAGWRCVYQPAAVVLHEHSATARHGSAWKHALVGRNRIRLLARNATRRQLWRNLPRILAHEIGYVVYVLIAQRDLAALRGRLRGLRQWRAARASGHEFRRPVQLAAPAGMGSALRRHRSWPQPEASVRPTIAPRVTWWKAAIGACVLAVCVAGVIRLANPSEPVGNAASGAFGAIHGVAVTTSLPAVDADAEFATDSDLPADNEPLWVFERAGRRMTARQMWLTPGVARSAAPITVALSERDTPGTLFDVSRWNTAAAAMPALVAVRLDGERMVTRVQELTAGGRVVARGVARIGAPAPGATRDVAVVRFGPGPRPDVVVIDSGQLDEPPRVTVVTGESRFTHATRPIRLPSRAFAPPRRQVDVVRYEGRLPELFEYDLAGGSHGDARFGVAHGEDRFARYAYSTRLDLAPSARTVMRTGTLNGAVSAYAIERSASSPPVARVIPLVQPTALP